ncbi:MAG: hypothetical protein KBF73_11485 [Flavobacteriales bacterium]|nr:hypothetical protein [Flavobacteriales bacterium]
MKKVLLSIITGALSISVASAQCTPDPSLAGSPFGLFPDSLETVYTCVGCGDQSRIVDLVTFTDTLFAFEIVPGSPTDVTVYIDAFKIVEVRNVPTGMSYGTNILATDPSVDPATAPFGIWFNNGTPPNQTSTQGCVYINGSEDQWNALANGGLGMVQLEIDVNVRIAGTNPDLSTIIQNGSWMSDVPPTLGGGLITVTDYWLVAQASGVGIVEVDESKFMLVNNYVDPATGITNISFNAPYNMDGLEFNVYSILGSKIHSEKFDVERGVNSVKFNGNQHAAGVYVYTISDGKTMLTNKMYTN